MMRRKSAIGALAILGCAGFLAFATVSAHAGATPVDNDCSAGYVAFTFDDGPGPHTPAVLKALRDLHLKATFFVLGSKLDASAENRRIIRDEVAGGFSVQNHTFDHASLTGASTGTAPLTAAQIAVELRRASAAIVRAGGKKPTLYRPPYGDVDAYDDLAARQLGYRIVMPWGTPAGNIVDAQDWTGITPAAIARNVVQGYSKNGRYYPGIRANSIVAMHDGEFATTQNMIESLQPIARAMNAKHLCSTDVIRPDATGGIVPAPTPIEPDVRNLLHNPGLETRRPDGTEPACFEHAGADTAGNDGVWSLTEDAHSGTTAARIDVPVWASGDRKLVTTQRASEQGCLPAVASGRTYTMSAWYKGDWRFSGSAPAKVGFATYYRDAAGTWVYWQSSPLLPPTSTWTRAGFTSAPLPAGATAVSFGLAISGPGSLTTDDYALAPN